MFCFPNRSQGNLTLCRFINYAPYAREKDEIWKKQFSGVSSHDLFWETTYKLKRCNTANVRLKLRNFQNEKWAGKNRLKQFLRVELAWIYWFSSVNDKERENLVTWYKFTFAVNAMINLSNVENWLWQQWSSCIYNIRICPQALNLTEYKTVDGKSGFYYFSFIQYLNNFSTPSLS